MARIPRNFPIPKLREVNGTFKIRWYADKVSYQITLGKIPKNLAKAICFAASAAFAGRGDFPEEIIHEPAIKRFTSLRNNLDPDKPDVHFIKRYITHMRANSDSGWHANVKTHLENCRNFCGTVLHATPGQLQEFLDSTALQKSAATRNRAQASLSGFFKWLQRTGHVPRHYNPLEDIKQMTEQRPHDGIVIWEVTEVKQLLKAANKRHDGIAIWIAVLAGLRRSEIARLKWTDISRAKRPVA